MKNKNVSEETLLYYADKIIRLCSRDDVNVKKYDGFIPLDTRLLPDDYFFFEDVTPKDLVNKDANMAHLIFGDEEDGKEHAQLVRLQSISYNQFRKQTGMFAVNPYLFSVEHRNLTKHLEGYVQFVGGEFKYIDVPRKRNNLYLIQENISTVAHGLLCLQFNLENQCYVYIKPEKCPIGFNYPIDSLGQLKELFKLRDIPDGYKRRAALRHWVAKHMRKKPSRPDELVEVKKHLRGKEDFNWFGMSGTIYVNF